MGSFEPRADDQVPTPDVLPVMLVIEDNPADRALLQEAFEDQNLRVQFLVAETSAEAFTALRDLAGGIRPSLILIDINIPTVSGHDVLEAFHRESTWKAVPKVVWTSSTRSIEQERSLARGAVAHLVKPSDFSGYLALVPILMGFLGDENPS